MSLRLVKELIMYKCQCFYLFDIQKRPKALLKFFIIEVDRLTLPKRPQDVILSRFFKMLSYIVVFSILTIGKHINIQVNIKRETLKIASTFA